MERELRFYAKRCILSMIETMSKHMVVMRDGVVHELLDFLDKAQGLLK